jgi:Na+/H+ antiporter NhaD/arsenite permease-like protein
LSPLQRGKPGRQTGKPEPEIGGDLLSLDPKLVVGIVFFLVYLYLVLFKRHRGTAVWSGVAILILFSLLIYTQPFLSIQKIPVFINWNVIGIFIGTLILAEIFIVSKVPVLLADILVNRSKNVGMAILWVCALASVISAFIENVATVLIVAPIALALARKLKVTPVPFLIGLAISSNLQGTATLIGDPPSMILAGNLHLNFNDFFIFHGKPGIFFAVELGAVSSFIVLYLFFRKYRQPVASIPREKVTSWVPTWLMAGLIVALALSPIWDPEFRFLGGLICVLFGVVGLIWQAFQEAATARQICKQYDWDTTFLLAGIFVLVGVLEQVGLIELLKDIFISTLGNRPFINYVFIVWFSVLVSGFIDNVPYVTTMIPVTIKLSSELGLQPYLLTFGLLIGACLGGNITPIGAAANIVSMGILHRAKTPTSFMQFVKIGLPFTIAATLTSFIFVWLIWR